MPIGLTPNKTVKVYLSGDLADESDKSKCPYFECRFLSCEAVLDYEEKVEAAAGEKNSRKLNAMLDDILKLGVVRWGNMGREIEPDEMYGKVLTPGEKWELVTLMRKETRLAEVERKNSGSAQRSGPADSAPNAAISV
jgi:hypothetical protein